VTQYAMIEIEIAVECPIVVVVIAIVVMNQYEMPTRTGGNATRLKILRETHPSASEYI